ncbi:MAG: histidine phosphatase family protein [Rhizobiaceae bacterium]
MYPLTYFVRHGQTDYNADGRLQGQADPDINALGRRQADENGEKLARLLGKAEGFDFVASPLRRTRETMERIRIKMELPAEGYRTDPRLMELNFGDWQGFTFAEIEARTPGATAPRLKDKWDFVPPGAHAESYAMLAERVKGWLAELNVRTICVAHGGVIRSLFHIVEHVPGREAANIETPQDRILKLENERLTWL